MSTCLCICLGWMTYVQSGQVAYANHFLTQTYMPEPDTIQPFNPTLNERKPRLDLGTTHKIMGSLLSETDRPP